MFGEVVLQLRLKGLDVTGAGVAPEGGVPGFSGLSPGLGLEMSSLAHQEEARLRASDPQDSRYQEALGGEGKFGLNRGSVVISVGPLGKIPEPPGAPYCPILHQLGSCHLTLVSPARSPQPPREVLQIKLQILNLCCFVKRLFPLCKKKKKKNSSFKNKNAKTFRFISSLFS